MNVTKGNFKQLLADVVSSIKTQQERVHELLVFALGVFAADKDSQYLTDVYRECGAAKGIRASRIADWIVGHTDLEIKKAKDGREYFKTKKGGEAGRVDEVTSRWFDYKKSPTKSDVDIIKKVNSIVSMLETEIDAPVEDRSVVVATDMRELQIALDNIQRLALDLIAQRGAWTEADLLRMKIADMEKQLKAAKTRKAAPKAAPKAEPQTKAQALQDVADMLANGQITEEEAKQHKAWIEEEAKAAPKAA